MVWQSASAVPKKNVSVSVFEHGIRLFAAQEAA